MCQECLARTDLFCPRKARRVVLVTGSNHVVAGALIATVIPQPAVAVPVALASHFVMDAMPHYGDNNKHSWLNRHFHYVLIADAVIAFGFLTSILVLQPNQWALIIACSLAAVLPDIIWLPYYIADLKQQLKPHGVFARFSKWIQWGERPWGIYLEAVVLVGLLASFISHVR